MQQQPQSWRTTPAGTHILSLNGEDVAHAWKALSGRFASYIWSQKDPVYVDTMDQALGLIKDHFACIPATNA